MHENLIVHWLFLLDLLFFCPYCLCYICCFCCPCCPLLPLLHCCLCYMELFSRFMLSVIVIFVFWFFVIVVFLGIYVRLLYPVFNLYEIGFNRCIIIILLVPDNTDSEEKSPARLRTGKLFCFCVLFMSFR